MKSMNMKQIWFFIILLINIKNISSNCPVEPNEDGFLVIDDLDTQYYYKDCNCNNPLKFVVIKDTSVVTNAYFFDNCGTLEYLALLNPVSRIYKYSFYGAPNLKDVYIPETFDKSPATAVFSADSTLNVYFHPSRTGFAYLNDNGDPISNGGPINYGQNGFVGSSSNSHLYKVDKSNNGIFNCAHSGNLQISKVIPVIDYEAFTDCTGI